MRFTSRTVPNFLRALNLHLRARLSKHPVLAEPEVVEHRRTLCSLCPYFDPSAGQCTVCTCFTFTKTMLATERCPEGFWEAGSEPPTLREIFCAHLHSAKAVLYYHLTRVHAFFVSLGL